MPILGGEARSLEKDELVQLVATVYPELRRIARQLLSRERTWHSIQPTSLANEFVVRLLQGNDQEFRDTRALIAYSIKAMQNILIDSGRRYRCRQAANSVAQAEPAERGVSLTLLLDLSRLLERLEGIDPRARKVVDLRYYLGLTVNEAATYLGVSTRTVNEDWEFARSWLAAAMKENRSQKVALKESEVVGVLHPP